MHTTLVRRLAVVFALLVVAAVAAAAPARPAAGSGTPPGGVMTFKDVDRLIGEQKLAAAAEAAAAIRAAAVAAGDHALWTRALVEETKLRIALSGHETAVRFLRETPWPDDATDRAVLDLYYANALVTYARAYSWEIRSRERVASSATVDLTAWTLEEIAAEAQRAFDRVWQTRGEWGAAPLGELALYLEQNSYPGRIRGTLRDAVSYLWVELLADTSLWRPEQAGQVFRLDLTDLSGDAPATTAGLDLTAPRVHPVLRTAAVLVDLEAWHRAGGRAEAAHEAHLERLRRLHAAFTGAADRDTIRRQLEAAQADLDPALEWWAMGQAALAEMIQDEAAADSQIRARAAALAGAERHPRSVGGQRCRHLVATIEAPAYQVEGMAADAPGQRSFRVTHRNLATLYLRAYPYDLLARLAGARDYNLTPGPQEVELILARTQPVAEWQLALAPTPDYRDHATDLVPPLTEPGAYLLLTSLRRDFADSGNSLRAYSFLVTDLVLERRDLADAVEVTARSGASGAARAGVEVHLYRFDWRSGHQRLLTATTAADGRASFATAGLEHRQHFLFARSGRDLAFDANAIFPRPSSPREEYSAALLYTDRSVYRPQQTVHFKVVAYQGDAERTRFATLPGRELTVTLVDANGEDAAVATVTTNDFGSASGELAIPAGRLLGQWRLRSSLSGETTIRVEEYKRPTFEVTVSDPTAPLRLNRPATLAGEARYYFGLPVSDGQVEWSVKREPVYPPWWFWWRPVGPTTTEIVAGGSTRLDADGRFTVSFTPAVDEREAAKQGISYRYRLSAEVTAEGGETRSGSRSFRLGFVAVEAAIAAERAFVTAGEAATLTVTRADLDGTPRASSGRWQLVALAQPATARLPADQPRPLATGADDPFASPADGRRTRWQADYQAAAELASWDAGEELAAGAVAHGDDGVARVDLGRLQPGVYRLVYTTEDDFGATCTATHELVVAGERNPVAVPVLLLVDRSSAAVGDTVRVLARSGLADQEMVLELTSGEQRVERRVLRTGRDAELIELPVTEALRGGFGLSLTLLRDHQLLHSVATVFVPWDDRRLTVELASFRDRLRPGAHDTVSVVVRGPDEQAVAAGAAELLASMYDRSLDLFAPHTPPDPLTLLPSRATTQLVRSSLGVAHLAWSVDSDLVRLPDYPSLSGDRLREIDGYGIGGPGARGRRFGYGGGVRMMSMAVAEGAPPPAPMAEMAKGAEPQAPADGAIVTAVIPDPAPHAPPPPAGDALRSDFSETAFFLPHLVSGEGGSVRFEFQVPDSVTEWKLWLHAITRDLSSGSLTKTTRTVKDLMVRPALPRFLREGDRAVLEVVVNNASDGELSGSFDLEIFDPETGADLAAELGLENARGVPFTVAAGGGTTLAFPVTAPRRVGEIGVRARATAGALSDGEQRSLPLLPGRMHLMQSRFAALTDADRRELHFADLAADDDPTRVNEQLVVTLDAQLFYSVLSALPYLVNYPYECTEQTLNRFLSTGIVSSLFDRYPAVATMAKELSARETKLEPWTADDPNRRMLLEETPWLQESRGGDEDPDDLVNVLDPAVAAATRATSLAKLEEAQTAIGAFPWWPGGPPSPYMTLYVVAGFARALEFGVEVPEKVVVRAWSYLHRHYLDELARDMVREDCCWETVTYLNYVLSSFPDDLWTGGIFSDDERTTMLDFSFRHWKAHSPLLKGYLALTLARAGRADDARLVFDAVMDSSKTDRDLGTYWAAEDRSWLWYNDTVEGHAFALRTLTELSPADPRRQGLVHWLLLNKKLNHWKSTRATAEVVYALAHYLETEKALGLAEAVEVSVGPRHQRFDFSPDRYTGRGARLVIPGGELDPATMSTVVVEKATKGLAFASATWHFSTERPPTEARGDLLKVERRYFRRSLKGDEWVLEPLADGVEVKVGDQLEVKLSLRAGAAAEYVHLRDPRGAGFEPESLTSRYRWDLGIGCYEEIRDSGANFFFEWLPAGEYSFSYRLRATMAGTFKLAPATLQSLYAPEFAAYSSGASLEVGRR